MFYDNDTDRFCVRLWFDIFDGLYKNELLNQLIFLSDFVMALIF